MSPTISSSQRSNAHVKGKVLIEADPNSLTTTAEYVPPNSQNATCNGRAPGVAFYLDDEQQAQLRRRGTVTAVAADVKSSGNSSSGGKSSSSSRGDDDLKRRWLLYCVALDKSSFFV